MGETDLDRYNRLEDETYEDYCGYGHKYTIYDLMDLERLILQLHDWVVVYGELDLAVARLKKEYDRIKESMDITEFGEEDDE